MPRTYTEYAIAADPHMTARSFRARCALKSIQGKKKSAA
jgi:hypothetical protein